MRVLPPRVRWPRLRDYLVAFVVAGMVIDSDRKGDRQGAGPLAAMRKQPASVISHVPGQMFGGVASQMRNLLWFNTLMMCIAFSCLKNFCDEFLAINSGG